jgi:type I restriction enzyme S subunit
VSQFNTESNNILNGRVFTVNRSELVGRWDAYFNFALKNSTLKTKYPTMSISTAFKSYSGGTPSKANLSYWDGDVPWVSPKDFKALILVDTEDHITEEAISNSATTIAHQGSLLMVVRSGVLAHTIPVAITTKPMAFNQDVKAFIQQADISTEFLAVYFQAYNNQLLPLIVKHSTTVQSINTVQLNTLKIPCPPRHLQEKIVRLYLNAVTAKKQKEQQAQDLLAGINAYLLAELGIAMPHHENGMKERVFLVRSSELFGKRHDVFYHSPNHTKKHEALGKSKYPLLKLGHISTSVLNGKEFREYSETGYRYLLVSDLDKHEIANHNPRYIQIDAFPESIRLAKQDILISRSGSLGLVSVVTDEILNSVLSSHIFKLRLNIDKIYPDYLQFFLRSTLGQFQFFQKNNGGVIPEINQSALKDISIIAPPIEKQKQVAQKITNIMDESKQLQTEAVQILADAKAEVERMILGE